MALRTGKATIPKRDKQLILTEFGTDLRKISQVVEGDVPTPGPNELLVRNRYVGVQAGEIMSIQGLGVVDLGAQKLPSPCGHEGIGEVVAAGAETTTRVGQVVVYISMIKVANREYVAIPESISLVVPDVDPAYLSFFGSGLTASIAFEKELDLKPEQTVLVTAAAGATGNFAVQLAKLAGCHVIGTCSSKEKMEYLKSLGCDRPVNYKEESLDEVLTKEYPNGLDAVYETVGKEMFDVSLKHIAQFGRLIIIGTTAEYTSGHQGGEAKENPPLSALQYQLLGKSASLRGFFGPAFKDEFPRHMASMIKLYKEGKIQATIECFSGLGGCVDAFEKVVSGKNVGKCVVKL